MSTDEGMKFAFVSAATEDSSYWDPLTEEAAGAIWDEWIDRVRAEAWDEGYLDRSPYGGRAQSRADNPYRETGGKDEHR